MGIAVLVIILSIALVARWTDSTRLPQTAVLRDGRRMTVLGAVIGNDGFTTERPWQRAARKILPQRLSSQLPQPLTNSDFLTGAVYGISSNELGIFVRGLRPGRWQIVDSNGFRYPGRSPQWLQSLTNVYARVSFFSYPRRERDLNLEWLDTNGAVLGRFSVPNPARGPFPVWQSQPMPQTVTNGPVMLTLQSLKLGNPADSPYVAAWKVNSTNPFWAQASNFSPLFVSDATGNQGPGLPPSEPAWTVRVFLERSHAQDFGPSEKITLANLAIPEPGTFVPLGRSFSLGNVGLKAIALVGAGDIVIKDGVSTNATPPGFMARNPPPPGSRSYGSSKPFLLMEVTNYPSGGELLFEAVDGSGKYVNSLSSLSGLQRDGPHVTGVQLDLKAEPYTRVTVEGFTLEYLPFNLFINPKDIQPTRP